MSWSEIMIILAVGMFVLGPERIPVAVKWVGSTLKTVRTMAAGAQEQLRGEFGPEIDELRRQVEELQGLKEIQELRKLRDLNPRSLITKNILGEEFSGGLTGMLGLNQPVAAAQPTGPGVAPETAATPITLDFPTGEPVQLTKQQPVEYLDPDRNESAQSSDVSLINQPEVNQPEENQPVVNQPVVNQPVVNQPVVNQPVVHQPAAVRPVDETVTNSFSHNGYAASTQSANGSEVNGHEVGDHDLTGHPTDPSAGQPQPTPPPPRHAAMSPYDVDAT